MTSFWDVRDRYRERLRHAENMLAFLGSVSVALLRQRGYGATGIDLRVPWQGGTSFGGWRFTVQRSATALRRSHDHPLALAIQRVNIGSENKGFRADVAALLKARNDYHHGRGPFVEDDYVDASNEVQERLQRCMKALSFFVLYPIRLVENYDVDRRSGHFWLKCLRLVGDGPGLLQKKVVFPGALPKGDLFLYLGNQDWAPLYPFFAASNCLSCLHRETYFIDQWNDRKGTTLMKTFERAHTEERKDISEHLSALASE